MKGSLQWIGYCAFAAGQLFGVHEATSQTKAPYKVEQTQLQPCPAPNSDAAKTFPPCANQTSARPSEKNPKPQPDELEYEKSRGPELPKPSPPSGNKAKSNMPSQEPTAVRATSHINAPNGGDDNRKSAQATRVLFSSGTSPISAIAIVGVGSLAGLFGSLLILKYRFAKMLANRPNGDVTRSRLFSRKQPPQPWQKATADPGIFQLQGALRSNLISRDEYSDLRSKYLIAGNFGFSMLMPTLLALVLITMNVGQWYEQAAISVAGALVTTLLTTSALDRRHQFRSEYRTTILRNSTQGRQSVTENTWAEELARIAVLLGTLATRLRSESQSSPTENLDEKGGE
jgi:hypothetical protein